MKTRKKGLWVLPLAALLAGIFFLSFLIGRYRVPALQVLRLLTDRFLSIVSFGRWGLAPTWTAEEASVVVQIRLPRILSAALIGAALSAAGTSYQAMFRNPMVSPDLLGASTGACFGAALAILLGAGYAVITASSFLFGLAAVGLTYLVGRLSRIRSTLAMVLAGMMVGSLFSAGTSFIKLVADTTDQLPAITYWLMGALTSVRLDDLHFAMVPILCGLIPLFFLRWRLNLLTVSEAEARSMGVNTRLLRLLVIRIIRDVFCKLRPGTFPVLQLLVSHDHIKAHLLYHLRCTVLTGNAKIIITDCFFILFRLHFAGTNKMTDASRLF